MCEHPNFNTPLPLPSLRRIVDFLSFSELERGVGLVRHPSVCGLYKVLSSSAVGLNLGATRQKSLHYGSERRVLPHPHHVSLVWQRTMAMHAWYLD